MIPLSAETKHTIDVAAVVAIPATIVGWLPHVATVLTIVWLGIRIYETETVQKILKKLGIRHE